MSTYAEKLKDPRWQRKRLEVLESAKWKCEDCGDGKTELQVHHCHYVKGREPWEYNKGLMCLCAPCHKRRQFLESEAKIGLSTLMRYMTIEEVESLNELIKAEALPMLR